VRPTLDLVTLHVDSGLARIEFGDPATRNLLTVPVLEALPAALADARARGARAIVLRGRGDIWSAGYDISQIPADLFDDDPRAALEHPFERCMRAVADCALPTLGAVNGHAVGGALELALCCDLRVARAGARFGITAARLGLVYPHAGIERLWQLVGPGAARRLLLTGDLIEAVEAEKMGLVHRVAAAEEFDAVVDALAGRLATAAPLAVRGMKQILRLLERGAGLSEADVLSILKLRAESFRSEDFREGRAAFEAKRPPRFRGR
jgi:enoyl-CoA hydratase/carnithine racemase